MQGGEGGLGIEINRKHAMAFEGQVLGEMRRCRRLAAAAFEIHDGNHVKIIVVGPDGEAKKTAATNGRAIPTFASSLPRKDLRFPTNFIVFRAQKKEPLGRGAR